MQFRLHLTRPLGLLAGDLVQRMQIVRGLKWRSPGQQLVEDHPECVNIRVPTDIFKPALGLLGSHINGRSQ